MALKRINLNLEEELVEKIDDYARKMYVNRTNAFTIIASQFFEQREAMAIIQQVVELEKMKSLTNSPN